ncbi:hypothetical protein HDV02_002903, partial [Globomyces sp. JEL0801]
MSQVDLNITKINAPEGVYQLRETITLPETVELHPLLGTRICMASIKSDATSTPSNLEKGSSSAKFIDITSSDGNDKFAFLKGGKKSKPQNNVTKTNSQFVSKIVANDQIAKILSQKSPESFYLFYNVGKTLAWTDYLWKLQCPLSVLYIKDAFITCHDVNQVTRETMNSVVGFTSGDILCFWPITGKYTRYNRSGQIQRIPVTSIKWVPGSESYFIAGFEDGSMMVFDKDMEDQGQGISASTDNYLVRPAPKASKSNPRSYWKISKKAITAIAFSPDLQHFAASSLDGTLKILNITTEKLLDVYSSFFGGVTCAAWSPDGRFIIAGSQDDLLSIYAFRGRLLARCQGHYSWPTSISFDQWKCNDRHFRFGSVGEDTRLCLWDFSMSNLRRPKTLSIMRHKSNSEIRGQDGPVVHPPVSK